MDDLISRQTAIDVVEDWFFNTTDSRQPAEVLRCLPSAQPERKKGRWIDMDDHVMCSCCGATHYGADKNYCPNCGARMDEEAE